MNQFISRLACVVAAGILFSSVAGNALAQNSPITASAPASQPLATVAVQPKTAAVAAEKAVPRSDVATLVKTGPSAADKARDMNGGTKSHAKRTKHPSQPASAASATGNQ